MCLSTVYRITPDEAKELVMKNVASLSTDNGEWVFTDLLGRTLREKAEIEKVDLLENEIYIRS